MERLLKSKIKESYHSILANLFMLFISELEFKIKYKYFFLMKKLLTKLIDGEYLKTYGNNSIL